MSIIDFIPFLNRKAKGTGTEARPDTEAKQPEIKQDDSALTTRGVFAVVDHYLAEQKRASRRSFYLKLAIGGSVAMLVFLRGIFSPEPTTNHESFKLDTKILAMGIPVLGALPVAAETGTIAVIRVNGAIGGSLNDEPSGGNTPLFLKHAFEKIEEEKHLAGAILEIDSPGGGIVASHQAYRVCVRAKERLASRGVRLVAYTSSGAYSGGYWIAMCVGKGNFFADSIASVANIGVIMRLFNTSGLGEKVGVTSNAVATGPLKNTGDQWEKMSSAQRSMLTENIDDGFQLFLQAVHEGRGIPLSELRAEATSVIGKTNGGWFSAKRAVEKNLLDGVIPVEDFYRTQASDMPDKKIYRSVDVVSVVAHKTLLDKLPAILGKMSGIFIENMGATLYHRSDPIRAERP